MRASVPGDSDLDGIPDLLDVDDDGDRILDRLDRLSATRVARTAADPPDPEQFGFFSSLDLSLDQTANANAAPPGSPLTGQQIDTVLSSSGSLVMDVMPGDALPNSPELDCGGAIQQPPRPEGLVYCRPHSSGGIGTLAGAGGPPFPDCCDPDEDGLGTLRPNGSPPPGTPPGMFLHHGATTAQIGTGDLLIQRVTRDGQETAFLAALHYVLATVPAVASYQGETGPPITVQYPYPPAVDPDGPGPSPARPPPFPVADGADPGADVEVTLTFWRPQREALPAWGETGDWIDVGRLKYEAQVEHSGRRCPQSAFSEQDPDLALHSSSPIYADHNPGFSELGPDRPASPANTFTYTLNLTQCLEPNGFSLNPGEERGFSFLAVNPNGVDNAQQGVWFKRE